MCGITGVITNKLVDMNNILIQAENAQLHRGPDDQGSLQYQINDWKIGLGHQRLSILDLSSAGSQPMVFRSNESVLVYNGEVYNFAEIKEELTNYGYTFHSDSDTEVILTAFHQWGIDESLQRFNGMWSFAWLDFRNHRLILSRDRAGKKPLYYFRGDNELYFASEIKTLLEIVPKKFSLNYQVVGEYLLQSLLATSNATFFKGINRIPAAHYCVIDLNENNINMQYKQYWRIPDQSDNESSEEALIEEIRETFLDAVRIRLRSDVPVGVLLSGGIDSSAITSAMQHILGAQGEFEILSAVSNDSRFDETPFIDSVGNYLKKPIHKVNLEFTANQAMDYLEQVSWYNDEPVGSFSNVAHYLLMKQARELGITVILSGQGADEILCGYKKYLGFYLQYLVLNGRYLEAMKVYSQFVKQGTILNQFSFSEAKRYLPTKLKPKEIDVRGDNLKEFIHQKVGLQKGMSVQQRQVLDVERFSVPVLTNYEDRMSMAWSREIRVPFLDYRLIEKLVPMSMEFKLKNGWTKYIFRKAMEPFLPNNITWRKDKQGFVNPQSEWLKNDLKGVVLDYFSEDSLIFKYKIVDREMLLKKYDMYLKQSAGKGSIWFKDIFNPLALEVWLRKYSKYLN